MSNVEKLNKLDSKINFMKEDLSDVIKEKDRIIK